MLQCKLIVFDDQQLSIRYHSDSNKLFIIMDQQLTFGGEKVVIFEEMMQQIPMQNENIDQNQVVFEKESNENIDKFVLAIAENVLCQVQAPKDNENDKIMQNVQIDQIQEKKADQDENQDIFLVQIITQIKEEPIKQAMFGEKERVEENEHKLCFEQIVKKKQDNSQNSFPVEIKCQSSQKPGQENKKQSLQQVVEPGYVQTQQFQIKQVEHEQKFINNVPSIQQSSPKIVETKTFNQIIQQRKQRLEQRYKKSQKIRATIIKLEPIATKKQSELKSAINDLKMAETAQFLKNKGNQQNNKPKVEAIQWKQQRQSKQKRIKDLIANIPSPQKKTPQVHKFIGISPSQSKKSKSPSNQKKSPSLPKLQRKGVSQRVMPYNIYNLYQGGPQFFKLSSLANP